MSPLISFPQVFTISQDTLEMSAVPLDRVSKILSSVKAQQLLTVIDACRNNPETGRSGEDNVLTDDFSKGFKIRRSSGNGGQPSVSATLYACNVGERAYEWADKGHGVFSYYLLEGLNGEAVNSQGEVTVTGLAEYTQRNVVSWAKEYRGKKQTPWLSLQGGAKLVLAQRGSTPLPPVSINAEAEMWELVKNSTEADDIRDFITTFPSSQLGAVARLKLKQLEREAKPTKPSRQKPQAELALEQQDPKVKKIEDMSGMVLIPAGPLTSAFHMDKFEVTNAQYQKFMQATGHRKPYYWFKSKFNQPNQPVVGISWDDAVAYCEWVDKRLPTEKEWEWAARGGLEGKKFPWGNQPPSSSLANYSYKVGKPTPVGSYPANGYGLYDMAGNAGEWCQDQAKLRGGSWDYYTSELEVGQRNRGHPTGRGDRYGFRCVADLP